jgi:hypothetical protein
MSLGDMLNIARTTQQYQQAEQLNPLAVQQQQQLTRTGQIQLGVAEQADKERRNMQTFFADPNNFQTDGRIDIDKINAQVPKIAPLTGADYISKFSTLSTAQTEGLKAKQNLTQDMRSIVSSLLGLLGRAGVKDPKIVNAELEGLVKQNPNNPDLKNLVDRSYMPVFSQMAPGPEVTDALIKTSQAILTPTQQQTAFAPQAGTLNTGEQIFPTVTTPAVGSMLPRIQMGTQPLADVGLSPTTEIIDPVTGQKRLIGPASLRGNAPLVTGLGPAQTSLLGGLGSSISEDLKTTLEEAKDAPQRISIFQNIKKLAPDAFTGPTAERRQMVASFAQMLGIPALELETTSTDELMKNTKLLQFAGNKTDAARELAQFANPNNKMTKEGIEKVSNQLIGVENMRLARASFLQPVANDAAAYAQRKQQFDQISDPRIFQELTADEINKAAKAMSAKEKTDMLAKIKLARQIGVVP